MDSLYTARMSYHKDNKTTMSNNIAKPVEPPPVVAVKKQTTPTKHVRPPVVIYKHGYQRSYWSSGGDGDDTCGGCGYRDTNCRCHCSSFYNE